MLCNDRDGKWVSVDEGDIAIETSLDVNEALPAYADLSIGQSLTLATQELTVTEKNSSLCIGVAGELPEPIRPGDRHDYAHLSGSDRRLFTLEYEAERIALYKGVWVDPFDVKAA